MHFSIAGITLVAFVAGACFGALIVGLLNGSKARDPE